ncbi:MAG: DUF5060 domain-containing protein [Pirellulaceae bacterium]|nr:DUF5060 domain-containing protein [Pirellulaceae bacterium]
MNARLTFVFLVATVLAAANGTAAEVRLRPLESSIGKYQRIEFEIETDAQYENAFDPGEVDMQLILKTPGGRELRLPAFFMQPCQRVDRPRSGRPAAWLYPAGPPGWRARFAPSEVGDYSVLAECKDRRGTHRSPPANFACTPSDNKGFVRVSRSDPRYFEFSEGQPFFPIGQNLAFVGESQFVTPPRVPEIFQQLSANGANYLRIWTCCHDWALAIEARKSAWSRSWSGKPPFAPLPGDEASGRQCLRIEAGDRGSLPVSPSHSVALLPRTEYALTGRVRMDAGARLQVTVGSDEWAQPLASADPEAWQPLELRFTTDDGEYWLGRTTIRVTGQGAAWIDGLSLKEAAGGPELLWEAAVNRAERGFYNPIDCRLLDDLVESAEQHGLYLQLCLITRDVYMRDLRDENSSEYRRAINDAKNLLRYAVARWGCSTSVAVWEYFNEMDPGLPLDRFYRDVGQYLEQTDVYGHLRSTSTWNRSAGDCRHPQLDVADVHFYLRPVEPRPYADEVEAVLGNAAWLREHASAKPALIGEFGLADPQWRPTKEMRESPEILDFHHAIWASALSGTSGTALFWWWDRLDPRNHYPHYRPLADFVADIPWTTANLRKISATISGTEVRLAGLQGDDRAYFWLFDPAASWEHVVIRNHQPGTISDQRIDVDGLQPGAYRVEWWDTRTGEIVRRDRVALDQPVLRLAVPRWQRDLAGKVVPFSTGPSDRTDSVSKP